MQGDTQHLASQQPSASPPCCTLGFHLWSGINRRQGGNRRSGDVPGSPAPPPDWDKLVELGSDGELPSSMDASPRFVSEMPAAASLGSAHPSRLGFGNGVRTGTRLHLSLLLQTLRRGGPALQPGQQRNLHTQTGSLQLLVAE